MVMVIVIGFKNHTVWWRGLSAGLGTTVRKADLLIPKGRMTEIANSK